MCIIVSKEQGIPFPSKSTLKTCFINNPDGAGFMYTANEQVIIRKGYMTFQAFWRSLKKARARTGDNAPYVLHFRISTQAGVNKQCCHPYPISHKMNDLKELATSADIGLAHNGIIDLTTEYTYTWSKNKAAITYNDTMKFITDYASYIIDNDYWYKDANKVTLLKNLIEDSRNRLAILDKHGHIEYVGTSWNKDDAGVCYSNLSWKPRATTVAASTYSSYKTYPTTTTFPTTTTPRSTLTSTDGKRTGSDYGWDPDFYDWTEEHYNQDTGWYDFEPDKCPSSLYQDEGFCFDCANYSKCLGRLYEEERSWYNNEKDWEKY